MYPSFVSNFLSKFHELTIFDSELALEDYENLEYDGIITKVTINNVNEKSRIFA
jgi:hypothetical protein